MVNVNDINKNTFLRLTKDKYSKIQRKDALGIIEIWPNDRIVVKISEHGCFSAFPEEFDYVDNWNEIKKVWHSTYFEDNRNIKL